MKYQLKTVQSHIEVYDEQGRFLFSADTQHEAMEELRRMDEAA